MTLPTVAVLLGLPELQAGDPLVVAGAGSLTNQVRWVHVSELADIAGLLNGGELLLTTGIALPADQEALARYVASLAEAGASGLVIELGRRFDGAPPAVIAAADRLGLPVAVLRREVRFVKVTEESHALIIESQLDEVRARQAIHEAFTELALEGASTAEIVHRAAAMVQRPVLLENLSHQVLALDAGDQPDALLAAWATVCRRLANASRTELVGERDVWLVTQVGARGEHWGRLAMRAGDAPPADRARTVLERAAIAISLNRLFERQQETLERQSHRGLLADIISGSHPTPELEARARALGIQLDRRQLVACVVRATPEGTLDATEREVQGRLLAERVAAASRETRIRAIVGGRSPTTVAALAGFTPSEQRAGLLRLAGAIHRACDGMGRITVSVGSTVDSLRDVRRSLTEAEQVCEAIGDDDPAKPYYQLPDVRLRGLLHILRDDPRVQTFYERELGGLIAFDEEHGTRLLEVLHVFLATGRNKTEAAQRLGLSRPAFYERLRQLTQVLGVDLDSIESCLSLHVALLGIDHRARERRAPSAKARRPGPPLRAGRGGDRNPERGP